MTQNNRETIQALEAELDFVEKGGYGRSVKTPWQPTSVFQDSPSCLNMGDPARTHPCNECVLIDFVTPEARKEDVPCHHILLNAAGATIDGLESGDQREADEAVKRWLRTTIDNLAEPRIA